MSRATRRAKASLSFSRCCESDLLHMLLERRRGAADRKHLLGQAVRRGAGGIDGAGGGHLDLGEPLLDLIADDRLKSVAGRFGKLRRALRHDLSDGLAGTLGRVRRGFLHLDHGVDQRRAGLVAEARRFRLCLGDGRRQAVEALAGGADAGVEAGEQRREAILLLGDSRAADTLIRSLASIAASRIQSSSGRMRSVERISRSAPASASPIAIESWSFTSAGQATDVVLQGRGTLGEDFDGAILCARFLRTAAAARRGRARST